MTVRNDELYKMFIQGDTGGLNHTETMQIKQVGDERLLVGYDTQIYAHRAQDGTVTKYIGWIGYDTSNTTNRQVAGLEADRRKDARPMILSLESGTVKPDGAEELKELGNNDRQSTERRQLE